MTPTPAIPDPGATGSLNDGAQVPLLLRRWKVVLVMDLVESVRLMAVNEAEVVQRWHSFVQHTRADVLPRHHGRLVKSLGDGLLAEFDNALEALRAATELHRYFGAVNRRLPAQQRFYMREGLNAAEIYIDANDIYGIGVNLAARVADLAGPGETMVTSTIRDLLADDPDVMAEDMGEHLLKHVSEPVRVWRIGSTRLAAECALPHAPMQTALPIIAVLPFQARSAAPEQLPIGELIADAVTALLGRSDQLRLISRLSTAALHGPRARARRVGRMLGAQFVLSGSYLVAGSEGDGRLLVSAELCETHSQQVAWTDRFDTQVDDLLQARSKCVRHIVGACALAIFNVEAGKARSPPAAALSVCSLRLGADP